MCEAATIIAGVGLGVSAIGGIAGALGQDAQGRAEDAAAQEQARLSDAAAADALQRGEKEAGRYRAEGSRVVAAQRVQAGASGVDVGSASITASMMDTRMVSELDAQTVRTNAAREAWGYKMEAATLRKHGKAALMRGQQAAGGTLLTTGAQTGLGAASLLTRKR